MPDDFVVPVPAVLESIEPVDVALILGSGLSGLADVVEDPIVVPFDDIEAFPRPERQVVGHAGRLVFGTLSGVRVATFQGRIHRYQGFSAREVAYPVRLAHALGASTLIVTNAAGRNRAIAASGRRRAHQRPHQPARGQPARGLARA